MRRNFVHTGMALLALSLALPALADSQFRIRRSSRTDIPLGKGQCDIALQVDNEVEVSIRRDMAYVRTLAGREARDDGSECNAPLPDRNIQAFDFQVTERRNDIVLLAEPSRQNGWTAVVRIRDSSGGEGRYRFRLTWMMTGEVSRGPGRGVPMGRGGESGPGPERWTRGFRFGGPGHGSSVLSGYGSQRLSEATVEIDPNGRVTVSFRGETERPLRFEGTLAERGGPRIRADVTTEDRRVRGQMILTIGRDEEVNSIAFEGGDQYGRLRVNWERN